MIILGVSPALLAHIPVQPYRQHVRVIVHQVGQRGFEEELIKKSFGIPPGAFSKYGIFLKSDSASGEKFSSDA